LRPPDRPRATIRKTTYSGPFSSILWFFNNSFDGENAVEACQSRTRPAPSATLRLADLQDIDRGRSCSRALRCAQPQSMALSIKQGGMEGLRRRSARYRSADNLDLLIDVPAATRYPRATVRDYFLSLAICLVRRDTLRLAARLWMTPFCAARISSGSAALREARAAV